jgi:multidrug transporter EmrE-like cation transporter
MLLTVSTGLVWGVVGGILSYVAKKNIDYLSFMTISSFFCSLTSWCFLCDFEAIVAAGVLPGGNLLWVMCSASFFSCIGFWFMRNAMRRGHNGIVWAIGQSAMIIPAIAAVTLLGEDFTFLKFLGFILILSSIALFSFVSRENNSVENNKSWLMMAVIAFLMLGASNTFCLLPSHWTELKGFGNMRLPFFMTGNFVFFLFSSIVAKSRFGRMEFFLAGIYAGIVLLGQILLFMGMDLMAEANMISAVYPIAIGICITSFTLYSVLVMREKASFFTCVGLLSCATGIVIVSIS